MHQLTINNKIFDISDIHIGYVNMSSSFTLLISSISPLEIPLNQKLDLILNEIPIKTNIVLTYSFLEEKDGLIYYTIYGEEKNV